MITGWKDLLACLGTLVLQGSLGAIFYMIGLRLLEPVVNHETFPEVAAFLFLLSAFSSFMALWAAATLILFAIKGFRFDRRRY